MKLRIKYIWVQLFVLLFMVSVAHAQTADSGQVAQPVVQSNFSQPELDQMLAPVALYPDGLLSQLLMASTYPSDVVEAASWSRANAGFKGDAAINAVVGQPWDISVKSLLAFPQVLSTMSTKIDWTERLGQAFLGQQQQVMDTIQSLRHKAMAAGYLRSDQRIRVAVQDQLVVIEPITPTQIYVPYYNPSVVYGAWWAPAYAPVYWDPWPGYAVRSGYYGWAWSPLATIITAGLIFGAFDWQRHHAYYGGLDYYGRHSHSHYLSGRTGDRTRWTRDSARPISRVSSTRTGVRTGTRTGIRSTTGTRTGTRAGTRTGARSTARTRTGARGTTGTRAGTRTGSTGVRSGGAVRSPAGGAGRATGGRAGGGGHSGKRD